MQDKIKSKKTKNVKINKTKIKKEEEYCYYSGLPSPLAYQNEV